MPLNDEYDFAIIIPACNEEDSLNKTLKELNTFIEESKRKIIIVIGINGSNDNSEQIAKKFNALAGVCTQRGYGYGCKVAIDAINKRGIKIKEGYIFFAADGANSIDDLKFIIKFRKNTKHLFIMGIRTLNLKSWREHGFKRLLPNLILGIIASLLAKRIYADLGPFRFIETNLFKKLNLRELTWGWTIEPQIKAGFINVKILTFPVCEQKRQFGEQKVSGVSPIRSFIIGSKIIMSGIRTRLDLSNKFRK